MNRKWIAAALGLFFFALSFFILLDHYFLTGIWFQPEDIHHETFVLSTAAMGIGILVGAIIIGNETSAKKRTKTTYC